MQIVDQKNGSHQLQKIQVIYQTMQVINQKPCKSSIIKGACHRPKKCKSLAKKFKSSTIKNTSHWSRNASHLPKKCNLQKIRNFYNIYIQMCVNSMRIIKIFKCFFLFIWKQLARCPYLLFYVKLEENPFGNLDTMAIQPTFYTILSNLGILFVFANLN